MTDVMSIEARCGETTRFLKARVPDFEPAIGIVLGSGLGGFASKLSIRAMIPYHEIPHFKTSKVVGHAGNLIMGHVGKVPVICQQGRYHYYEGHSIQEVTFPIQVMAALGVHSLVVTNAAGGINEGFAPGDIMLITDHINFTGTNPLIGPNIASFGPRFPDMSTAYDPEYGAALQVSADSLGIHLRKGVYIGVSGPSYETPAEIRAFRVLGADAVGMSTVPEVIVAHHRGLRVLGISCISNAAAGMGDEPLSHADVERVVDRMGRQFENLVEAWIEKI